MLKISKLYKNKKVIFKDKNFKDGISQNKCYADFETKWHR